MDVLRPQRASGLLDATLVPKAESRSCTLQHCFESALLGAWFSQVV